MIKYILILISTILILIITYEFLVNQKITDPIKPAIELKPINKVPVEKNVNTISKKDISSINKSKKIMKKDTFPGDEIPMDLTYEPLLNKTKNHSISNEEFEEIEKNIRNSIIHLAINTTLPYNNDISLENDYIETMKNPDVNVEFSHDRLREYESNILLPQNNISYLYQDEDISAIINTN